jgi:hypothetical protein
MLWPTLIPVVPGGAAKAPGRSPGYTEVEILMIAKAFIAASKDPIKGTPSKGPHQRDPIKGTPSKGPHQRELPKGVGHLRNSILKLYCFMRRTYQVQPPRLGQDGQERAAWHQARSQANYGRTRTAAHQHLQYSFQHRRVGTVQGQDRQGMHGLRRHHHDQHPSLR